VLAMMGAYVEGGSSSRADAAADAMLLMNRAAIAEKAGRLEEAMSDYRLAATTAPEEGLVQLNYGRFLQRRRMYDAAIDALVASARLGARSYGAYSALASVYLAAGKPQEAYEAIELSLKDNPGKPGNLNQKARICVALGRHDEALSVYEDAVQRISQQAQIKGSLAGSLDRFETEYLQAARACGQQLRAKAFLAKRRELATA
jgi:Tfp pilus assembly protein PilF